MEKCPVCKSENIHNNERGCGRDRDLSVNFCYDCGVLFYSEKVLERLKKRFGELS